MKTSLKELLKLKKPVMNKKSIYTLMLVALTGVTTAQQLPIFSQYYYNPFIYNPGFTGQSADEKANAYIIHRSQWKDMPGAPVTYAITVDGPVMDKKIGLGFSMFNDQTDMLHRNGIYTSYSYKFKIAEDQYIIPGLAFGMIDNRIDLSRSIVKDLNDPFLMTTNRRKVTFDANFGVAYIWKDLRVGLSAMQLLGNKIGFLNNDGTGIYQKLQQQFILSAQYGVMISESAKVKALPSIMLRYTAGSPFQFDVNAIFEWNDLVRGGVSYRHGSALGLTAGVKLNKCLMAGYTYELQLSSIKKYSGGGHEIMLGYSFGGPKTMDDSKMKELMSKIEQAQIRNDSLANELRKKDLIHDEEIKKLKAKTDSIATNQANAKKDQGNNNNTNNNTNVTNNTNNDLPKGTIRAEAVADYTDESGNPIASGYYVIVESFRNISNAKTNKDFYEKQKQIKVMTIFNKKRKFYYNSVLYTTDEESAVDLVTEVKKEKPDSWVFKLSE